MSRRKQARPPLVIPIIIISLPYGAIKYVSAALQGLLDVCVCVYDDHLFLFPIRGHVLSKRKRFVAQWREREREREKGERERGREREREQ